MRDSMNFLLPSKAVMYLCADYSFSDLYPPIYFPSLTNNTWYLRIECCYQALHHNPLRGKLESTKRDCSVVDI